MFRSIMSTEELELLDNINSPEGTVDQGTNIDGTTDTNGTDVGSTGSEGTKNILSLNTEIDQITNKLDAYLNSRSSNSIDKYPDYEPINIKDAKTLVSKLEEKIANTYGPGEKNYMDVIAKYNDNFFNNIMLRIAGNNASDVKAARKVVSSINSSSSKIFHLVALLNKATYSVVRYIEDSSK